MSRPNRIARVIHRFSKLPRIARGKALSLFTGQFVPYVGTSRVRVEEMTEQRVTVAAGRRQVLADGQEIDAG